MKLSPRMMERHHTGGYHRPTHFSRRVSRFSAIFYSVVAFLFFFCFGLIGHTLRNHRLRGPLLKLSFCLLFDLFFTEQEGIQTRECVCMCIVLIMRRQSHARMIIPFLSGKRTTCLLHIDPANAFFFFLPLYSR